MLKQVQKGFTLIELMIVVAIIGILAAIAIPAYQDYVIRSQVSEGLAMASSLKASVSEFYAVNGAWPTDDGAVAGAGDLGLAAPPSGKYVAGITVDNGNLVIQFGQQANAALQAAGAETLVVAPGLSANDDVIWVCGNAPVPATVVGGAVAAPANAGSVTSVLGKYLPTNCR
jgi:type IV pilus assembly protein PilA